MLQTRSHDGTAIAYDQIGAGPPIILVGGALNTRSQPMFVRLAELLAPYHTVIRYDRRGRGESGDTPPYAVAREVDDLEALVESAGGRAAIYGLSSGGVLALTLATRSPGRVARLAIYEPPLVIDSSRPPAPANYASTLESLVASGRRGEAVELFLARAAAVPEAQVAAMRAGPRWPEMEAIAHTLAYEARIMENLVSGAPPPPGLWSAPMPTLVLDGGASPEWLRRGAQSVADMLPGALRQTLPGQRHNVESTALAPALIAFFADRRT